MGVWEDQAASGGLTLWSGETWQLKMKIPQNTGLARKVYYTYFTYCTCDTWSILNYSSQGFSSA
jgi:hypothetical protein